MKSSKLFRSIALSAVVLILVALAAWYFVLSSRTSDIENLGEARGFGESIPTFGESFGSTFENISSGVDTNESGTRVVEEGKAPELWRVSSVPVAGLGFVGSSTPRLWFVEKATGYAFEVHPGTGAVRRLSNTLVPKVHESHITQNGTLFLRYLDDEGRVSTFSGAPATTTDIGPLSGRELPKGILAIAPSPDGSSVFYITSDGAGAFSGVRARANGSEPQKVLSTAVSGWRTSWLPSGIFLTQKAAGGIFGYSYLLNGSSPELVVGNVSGLSVLPDPRSKSILYSGALSSSIETFVRAEGASGAIKLPIRTLAEKCVWDPAQTMSLLCAAPQTIPHNYLDGWYRGVSHTLDSWWRVDAVRGTAEQIQSDGVQGFGVDIFDGAPDVLSPTIDPTGAYIAFLDAQDETLWLLRIRP